MYVCISSLIVGQFFVEKLSNMCIDTSRHKSFIEMQFYVKTVVCFMIEKAEDFNLKLKP